MTGRCKVTLCLLVAITLTACGSFEASIGREDGGATPPSPSGGTATPAASTHPDDRAAPSDSASSRGGQGGDGEPDRNGTGASPLPQRIRFASGETSATVEGMAAEGAHRRYVLAARQGQTMRIRVTSPSDAVNYGLTAPDGQPIKRVAAEARQGQFELPATGDYAVTIASAIDGAPYTLRVEIQPTAPVPST